MKTDARLRQDIIAELGCEPSIDAAQIGVEVRGGIVTLAGQVESYAQRRHAERALRRVAGLKGLATGLDVRLPASSRKTDAEIARAAAQLLQWATYLPPNALEVKVDRGWITLSGEVEWEYQRRVAVQALGDLPGVIGMSEAVTLKPQAGAGIVTANIEAALRRRALGGAQRISVEVRDGNVTLAGTVRSWSEREVAIGSAWGTPGVRHVVDNLTIA